MQEKKIIVTIDLIFTENGNKGANIDKTKGVPWSLIVESLNNLQKGMSEQLVKEAAGDVEEKDIVGYLDGMIELDRIKLKELFK